MPKLLSILQLLFLLEFHAILAADIPLPVILPPYGNQTGSIKPDPSKKQLGGCLLYMENLGVVVFQSSDTHAQPSAWPAYIESTRQKHTYAWDETKSVNCEIQPFDKDSSKDNRTLSFVVDIKTGEQVEAKQKDKTLFTIASGVRFAFNLIFKVESDLSWKLVNFEALEDFEVSGAGSGWLSGTPKVTKGPASNESVAGMEVGAYADYNYGCSNTKVALFDTDNKNVKIGIALNNVQIQAFGITNSTNKDGNARFAPNTADCVGTFTSGSLMGIIVALVLASVLVFGFLMLNSVQTVDRFDDPKQKQMIINAKE